MPGFPGTTSGLFFETFFVLIPSLGLNASLAVPKKQHEAGH